MPSGAPKRVPHDWQDHPSASAPLHAGHASRSRKSSTSEDRVDERGQRFDGGSEDQHEAEETEEDGERHEPPLVRVAPPQAADQIGDRPSDAAEHDQPARHAPAFFHATSSLSRLADADARLVTIVEPATSTSIPERRNV